jgi:LysR family transcriptional regulator, glycine cleavage system transcriptional activator
MRRLPPLNALRAFEAAARLSSVSAAARELGVSHSAISQQIKLLEHYFGQQLFERPGRRVEPTPAAMALLEDVKPVFDRIAMASERLARRGLRRILTVNATPFFAMRWLIPRIAGFQAAHPELELRVSASASQGISHLDKAHDIVIRRGPISRPGYICRRLIDDCATPIAQPDLVRRAGLTHPGQLIHLPLLHTRSRPTLWRDWFRQQGVPTVETLDGPFFDDTSLMLQGALSAVGFALAPVSFVADDLKQRRLAAPLKGHVVDGPGYHILFRASDEAERGIRELLKWLDRQAQKSSARTSAL